MSFRDKVVLVTGAGSGIGRGAAIAFAREGARVTVTDLVEDGGQKTVGMIRDAGGEAFFVRTDVTREDQVQQMVEKTLERYGRLDCAFNNAGIPGEPGPISEVSAKAFRYTVEVNLTGVFLCLKHEIHAITKPGGTIVNTISMAGKRGAPNLPAYIASKHGLVGLTKAAALEFAEHGVRVNAVCPGVILTPKALEYFDGDEQLVRETQTRWHPLGRIGEVEEVADVVLFLCSERSGFVTGVSMPVDGGHSAAL